MPADIDIVDIFRKPEAIAVGAKCVWMQLGLAHNQAADKAAAAGLAVVMNKCMKIEIERRDAARKTQPARKLAAGLHERAKITD